MTTLIAAAVVGQVQAKTASSVIMGMVNNYKNAKQITAQIETSISDGKGTVQTLIRLPNKGELTLTWARMHAPSGFALQDHGIIPAICTSSDTVGVAKLVGALRSRGRAGPDLLENQLKARLARRADPQLSRAACPPHAKEPAADMVIARHLFQDQRLYAKTLVIGRPAVAERPRNDARARP